jgi:hypothetical protein
MSRKVKKKLKGGSSSLQMYLFDPNKYLTLFDNNTNSSYGPIVSVSYGSKTGESFPKFIGPNLAPYPNASSLQTGGNTYNFITDPITNKKINIYSYQGTLILKKYIKHISLNYKY